MFKRILVPVDGSEQALRALDVATDLAQHYGSEVLALCVYRHHSPLEASLSMVRASVIETPDAALKAYATEIARTAKQRAKEAGLADVGAYARRGQPARTIVAFAEEKACDTIVMGTRGQGDIGGFLLGSVSHKVSSMAKVTCVLVR